MKIIHTADWHLGKLVQGVYMTDDQRYILEQFIQMIKLEKPDAVIIAGDLYDRAVPPTEAVLLLDDILEEIVLDLNIPVFAIAGNHDSPSRVHFGSKLMKQNGFHIIGHLTKDDKPIILQDEYGEVHFHLVPYCDPSIVRHLFEDDTIRTHNDAMQRIVENIENKMDRSARHIFVGHAFVTPFGKEQENTSDSERPLSIGGAEYVDAHHFAPFQYTALGHLHQGHYVLNETIRYAGSILKYSISEENHNKGFQVINLDEDSVVSIEKRPLIPRRDMRTVEAMLDDLLLYPVSDDYIFVKLLDETPVLSPMEKVRSVYPNAMHIERQNYFLSSTSKTNDLVVRNKMSDIDLFKAFYKEVKGMDVSSDTEEIFVNVLDDLLKDENETGKSDHVTTSS